jgi:hypothetical protein
MALCPEGTVRREPGRAGKVKVAKNRRNTWTIFVSSREVFGVLLGNSTEELTFRQGLIKIKKTARL